LFEFVKNVVGSGPLGRFHMFVELEGVVDHNNVVSGDGATNGGEREFD
jgi:hypothetical protein